jgi:hypothetical protein
VPPRLSLFRPEEAAAVVSIVCCDSHDFGRGVWTGGAPQPDELISANGQRGRLAQVLAAGGPAAFHTHWQTLFAQGTYSGLHALGEVVRRLETHFGGTFAWTRCADLASYAAAAAAVEIVPLATDDDAASYQVHAPFPCRQFTLSLDAPRPPREVGFDAEPLQRVERPADLREGCYATRDGRLYLCWSLRDGQRLRLTGG